MFTNLKDFVNNYDYNDKNLLCSLYFHNMSPNYISKLEPTLSDNYMFVTERTGDIIFRNDDLIKQYLTNKISVEDKLTYSFKDNIYIKTKDYSKPFYNYTHDISFIDPYIDTYTILESLLEMEYDITDTLKLLTEVVGFCNKATIEVYTYEDEILYDTSKHFIFNNKEECIKFFDYNDIIDEEYSIYTIEEHYEWLTQSDYEYKYETLIPVIINNHEYVLRSGL